MALTKAIQMFELRVNETYELLPLLFDCALHYMLPLQPTDMLKIFDKASQQPYTLKNQIVEKF